MYRRAAEAALLLNRGGNRPCREMCIRDRITEGLKKDVVQKQLALICMRNTHKAFSEGAEVAISGGERSLEIRWEYNSAFAILYVNFESGTYTIVESR